MRRAHRVDANQARIVSALRKAGRSVYVTSQVGQGYPDLTVGFRGRNYLLELKDPAQPPSKRALTGDELEFFAEWRGQVAVVHDEQEAIDATTPKDETGVVGGKP